jgi:phage terminase large subunit
MPTRAKTILVEIAERVFLPIYRHLLKTSIPIFIHFLWGGRDSGKSHFIAQALVKKCLTAKKFRCLLIKKTHNSIKEAQWQTIKDIVDEWGLSALFTFRVAPLEIECINGNKFIARGCDDPQNIKSTKDPTDAWIEEGNQLDYEEFLTIVTTLRSNQVEPQIWFSFNPECKGRYQDFWLYKMYFQKYYEQGISTFTDTARLQVNVNGQIEEVAISYSSTHTTYHDNQYCSPLRRAFLEQLKQTAPYYYTVYTQGKWGTRQVESPFCFAYSRAKHVSKVIRQPAQKIILSFDFNRNPITCFVAQLLPGFKVRGLEQIKLKNSDIYSLCRYIKVRYPNALFEVTGDATGSNSTAMVKDNLNFYRIIKNELNLGPGQFKVPRKNPDIEDNQVLVNAVLQMVDCQFDEEGCAGLLFDFENVETLPDGAIDKRDRKNPAMQADALDCFRYFCNVYLPHIIISPIKKANGRSNELPERTGMPENFRPKQYKVIQ